MDLSVLRSHGARAFVALLALTLGAGAMQAANLLTATASVAVTCNTATGPGTAANIVVKPATSLTGSNTIVVSFTAPGNGLTVTAPNVQTLSTANQSAGLTYTVANVAACVGASTGATTLHFTAGGNADAATTVNDTVTSSASALVAAPVALSCTLNGRSLYSRPGADGLRHFRGRRWNALHSRHIFWKRSSVADD